MKQPHAGNYLPDFHGQTKILFCTEGNPVAMLLTNQAGRRSTSIMNFAQAEAALAWCRQNAALMVYAPLSANRN